MNKITIFFSGISQQTLKMYEKINHNYSNLAQSQILFYMQSKCIVPDHGTQYEKYLFRHYGGMPEDGLMD